MAMVACENIYVHLFTIPLTRRGQRIYHPRKHFEEDDATINMQRPGLRAMQVQFVPKQANHAARNSHLKYLDARSSELARGYVVSQSSFHNRARSKRSFVGSWQCPNFAEILNFLFFKQLGSGEDSLDFLEFLTLSPTTSRLLFPILSLPSIPLVFNAVP